jgi:pilus assembly protein FimV
MRVVPGQPVKIAATKTQQEATSVPVYKPAADVPPASMEKAKAAAVESPAGAIGPGRYGPVQFGETLLGIVGRARPEGVSMEQTFAGIYRANPDAFEPDHHRLKKGVVLTIPTREQLAAIDQNEAVAELRAASEKWRAAHAGKRQ